MVWAAVSRMQMPWCSAWLLPYWMQMCAPASSHGTSLLQVPLRDTGTDTVVEPGQSQMQTVPSPPATMHACRAHVQHSCCMHAWKICCWRCRNAAHASICFSSYDIAVSASRKALDLLHVLYSAFSPCMEK